MLNLNPTIPEVFLFLVWESLVSYRGVEMNVVGKFKEKHRRAKKESEDQRKLEVIPTSRINGIAALPVELWSIILEHVVTSQLGPPSVQCWTISDILDQRLVCRKPYQSNLHHTPN
jgi:hypothetical protein